MFSRPRINSISQLNAQAEEDDEEEEP